ncbi:putative leucine-rich repeat domain, L domain-containing protein [Heracleum sosnowskyi]|uniref:Leucine-rich repeat domain, L domain-containing protein n=1 Tax=Heracleum sosnowskyi TaxID=360622 RepID=A0AAD8HD61_9APIA|nr:putative leucine-rich repeat domain, L domain-containing protein [Heracleum sosnowskyi]
MHFQGLVFLNLGHNKFSGGIPTSIGHLTSLETIILRNNKLHGELPASLRNCSSLGFADFGLNKLLGEIPSWIGDDLTALYALILKSNRFYGSMPYELCKLSNLHFLDLSMNRIFGTIPPCFGNFTAMIERGTEVAQHNYSSSYDNSISYGPLSRNQVPKKTHHPDPLPVPIPAYSYIDNVLARWKGQEFEYGRNFAYLKMIDLSTNELTGKLPLGITRLLELKGLNLSGNSFYGNVPTEIGQLKLLECLDLSANKFSGKIPSNMSGLHFLAYLNISNNNFSGRIPSGTQLQGFAISTYEGNTGLCGRPLKNICCGDELARHIWPSSSENGDDGDDTEYERWLYVSAVIGFSTSFWSFIGTLVLNRRWRLAYFCFLYNLKEKCYVTLAVHIARLQRNF